MFLPTYYIWTPQASDFTLLVENRPPKASAPAADARPAATLASRGTGAAHKLGAAELRRSPPNCNQIPLEMSAEIFINTIASSC